MSAELGTDEKRRHPRSTLNPFLRSPPLVATPDVAAITNNGVRQHQMTIVYLRVDANGSLREPRLAGRSACTVAAVISPAQLRDFRGVAD